MERGPGDDRGDTPALLNGTVTRGRRSLRSPLNRHKAGSAPRSDAPRRSDLPPGTLPDVALLLNDGEVARLGGRESLREAALANLRALPVPRHQRAGAAHAHFEVIIDDHFTASRVLVMRDLVSRVLGTHAPYGVLAAIPARNFAFIDVLADKAAAPSLGLMANTARTAYQREQVPISPDVSWLRDGDLTPIPSVESDGKLTLRPGPELSALLTDLPARPHPNEFS
jgi:hypothetical protein